MAKRYIRINFQNSPSTATQLDADNLNKLDKGIDDCDNAIEELYNEKLDKAKIADNLITDSADFVLSARQGKVLNDNLANFRFYYTIIYFDNSNYVDIPLEGITDISPVFVTNVSYMVVPLAFVGTSVPTPGTLRVYLEAVRTGNVGLCVFYRI